ncbi:hypothetical protein OH76DRAFT_1403674 [Lentinus brumalis]|uniref:HMG box domain-containing protein n=1 Tax=Lentinus brumalis TaxID=2498619 RepID=A0A371DA98_9APHY|nr:hypothetical protein OH76DRAFT_1403674 [Polyporus brumalis]
MIARLCTRVLPRPLALNVAAVVGLRVAQGARQHMVARTFLTTAHVSEPAAKEGATKSKSKTTAKKTTKTTAAKKASATKKAPTTKKKPAKKAARSSKRDSNDPEARFKNGLKSVKVKKAEEPPIKPMSPYSLFVQDQYKDGAPTGNFAERSSVISARWKQLGDAEKQAYTERAESLKEQFAKAQEEWYGKTDPRILRAINVQRKAQNKPAIRQPAHLRPKRPLSSYMLYMMDVRDSVAVDPSLPSKEAMLQRARLIGKMWHELPAEDKERYVEKSKKIMEEYKAEQSVDA